MPYINKDGKPVLWEETNYWNQYRKALIYYPVKAKRISTTPVVSSTPSVSPTNTPTVTPTNTPTPTPTIPETYYLETHTGDDLVTHTGDNLIWFPM